MPEHRRLPRTTHTTLVKSMLVVGTAISAIFTAFVTGLAMI